jgi:hypothetical protein
VGLLISTIPPPLAVVGFSGVCLVWFVLFFGLFQA